MSRSVPLLIAVFLLGLLPRAGAQEQVTLANGKVAFLLPPGFRAMTDAEIKLKYPTGNAPQFAYGNERLNVSIAITFSSQMVSMAQLPELKSAMEQMLPRLVPSISWITREMLQLNGRTWVHFELTSTAIDTDIHNEMYLTSFEGKMLGFNFNATKAQYPPYKETLHWSRDTIRILP